MVAIQIFSLAALAISAIAVPVTTADNGKQFRIGIDFTDNNNKNTTLYLTANQIASPNREDGIKCSIYSATEENKSVNKLACGPDKKAFTYSELHSRSPLQLVTSDKKNVGWSLGQAPENLIQWKATQGSETEPVTFSRERGKDANKIFAEVCSSFNHHKDKAIIALYGENIINFWQNGVARAYFDKE